MVTAMLYTSIGIGYLLVSLEANVIGYWILGTFLGIVLTLAPRPRLINQSINQSIFNVV